MKKTKDQIQDEALSVLKDYYRAGVAIATGGGKTLLGIKHMMMNYHSTAKYLVVAPKLTIFEEWKKEAINNGFDYLLSQITFITYRSLPSQLQDYDIVYLDECHSLLNTHDFWLSTYGGKILGLTGSPPKVAYSEKGKLVAKYCPIVYTYETDEAVENELLNDYRIIIHLLPLDKMRTMKIQSKSGSSWVTSELESYNYWCKRLDDAAYAKEIQMMRLMRMKALMGFPSKERYALKLLSKCTDKTILFANSQAQADKFGILSFHSSNPASDLNLERFRKGQVMKLAAVQQLNEGVNIPDLKIGILMHAYGNERKTTQRIGRCLRLNPSDKATIHILCYKDTIDVDWVYKAIAGYNTEKITWIEAYL